MLNSVLSLCTSKSGDMVAVSDWRVNSETGATTELIDNDCAGNRPRLLFEIREGVKEE